MTTKDWDFKSIRNNLIDLEEHIEKLEKQASQDKDALKIKQLGVLHIDTSKIDAMIKNNYATFEQIQKHIDYEYEILKQKHEANEEHIKHNHKVFDMFIEMFSKVGISTSERYYKSSRSRTPHFRDTKWFSEFKNLFPVNDSWTALTSQINYIKRNLKETIDKRDIEDRGGISHWPSNH